MQKSPISIRSLLQIRPTQPSSGWRRSWSNLKTQGLKSPAALYLIWNEDLNGTSAPEGTSAYARTRADFSGIDDQFQVVDDPTGDILRARMDLVYGTEATSTFLSVLAEPADADALQLDVPFTNPQPTLKQAIIDTDANIGYDNFRSPSGCPQRGYLRPAPPGFATLARRAGRSPKAAIDALFDRSRGWSAHFSAPIP